MRGEETRNWSQDKRVQQSGKTHSEQPSGKVRSAGKVDGIANGKISNITKINH